MLIILNKVSKLLFNWFESFSASRKSRKCDIFYSFCTQGYLSPDNILTILIYIVTFSRNIYSFFSARALLIIIAHKCEYLRTIRHCIESSDVRVARVKCERPFRLDFPRCNQINSRTPLLNQSLLTQLYSEFTLKFDGLSKFNPNLHAHRYLTTCCFF